MRRIVLSIYLIGLDGRINTNIWYNVIENYWLLII
jgi:hypothetical protein